MALLYRAVWQEERRDLVAVGEREFVSWLKSKGISATLPEHGSTRSQVVAGAVEIVVHRASITNLDAARFELVENRDGHGEQWTTALTILDGGNQARWIWVDLERVADMRATRPITIAAPRLVRDLLSGSEDARVDQVRISSTAASINPPGLAGLIRNVERTLPLVVFSEGKSGFTASSRRADELARRLAGAAQVYTLSSLQVDDFKEAIGDELAVWGGAARVYLPNAGPAGMRPSRHRYLRPEQLEDDAQAARHVSSIIGGFTTSRRPPPSYESIRKVLFLGQARLDADLLKLASDENEGLRARVAEAEQEIAELQDDLLETQADLEAAVEESAWSRNQLRLIAIGSDEEAIATEEPLLVAATSMSEALRFARERLGRIVVPPDIERDIDDLDGHINSVAWGELTWRGLRALHVYAAANFDGNFKQWCMHSGHALGWPGNDKKLAMRESEFVESNGRLRDQRRLPVAPEVNPSGFVHMWAHLKIAEGGGPLAPRVYFHDDTRGVTGKVHVGFVGPHRYMENSRTN